MAGRDDETVQGKATADGAATAPDDLDDHAAYGLRRLSQSEAEEACRRHLRFLRGRTGGARANLSLTDLSHLDLSRQDLSHAELNGARLVRTHLRGSRLTCSNLFAADLREADLVRADLSRADRHPESSPR